MPLSRRQILAAGALLPLAPSLLGAKTPSRPSPSPATPTRNTPSSTTSCRWSSPSPSCPAARHLAVTKDSKLVYDRGFGYADRDAKAEMKPPR